MDIIGQSNQNILVPLSAGRARDENIQFVLNVWFLLTHFEFVKFSVNSNRSSTPTVFKSNMLIKFHLFLIENCTKFQRLC